MLKYLGIKCHYVSKLLSNGSAREREKMYNMLMVVHEEYMGVCCSYSFNFSVDLKIFKYKNGKNL